MTLMLAVLRGTTRAFVTCRLYTSAAGVSQDLRAQILNEVKEAMKRKNPQESMTLRSVLSEINSAEKATGSKLNDSATASIIRKAIQRRSEAVARFTEAKRLDLANKEQFEVDLLSKLLPPLLTTEVIDVHIKTILDALPASIDPRKASGLVFKEFYYAVDKSMVDSSLVKERVSALLNARV